MQLERKVSLEIREHLDHQVLLVRLELLATRVSQGCKEQLVSLAPLETLVAVEVPEELGQLDLLDPRELLD